MIVALTEAIEPAGKAILREAGHDVIEGPGGEQSRAFGRAVPRGERGDRAAEAARRSGGRPPPLLVAVRHGVGLDLIPVEHCTEYGVLVTNVPGANADAVAEFVVAQMLAGARQLQQWHAVHLAEGWKPGRALAATATELRGRTLGIVGVGAIGKRLAEIAHHGFRMKVLGFQRRRAALPDFWNSPNCRSCSPRATTSPWPVR